MGPLSLVNSKESLKSHSLQGFSRRVGYKISLAFQNPFGQRVSHQSHVLCMIAYTLEIQAPFSPCRFHTGQGRNRATHARRAFPCHFTEVTNPTTWTTLLNDGWRIWTRDSAGYGLDGADSTLLLNPNQAPRGGEEGDDSSSARRSD